MGTTGLESAFAVLHTELVLPGELPLATLRRAPDRRRARCSALETAAIAVGRRANLCLVDLDARWRIGEAGYESRSANCCFAGREVSGARPADDRRRRRRLPRARIRAERRMSYVLLEDGARFDGEDVGAPGPVTGEVVFNTAMSGYQESMTDPSYARQLITFTYPHIGNYGVRAARDGVRPHPRPRGDHARRAQLHATAPAPRRAGSTGCATHGVAAISGVDTRALVRHIRDAGRDARRRLPRRARARSAAAELIAAEPLDGRARPGRARSRRRGRSSSPRPAGRRDGPTIALLDTGVKTSILANLRARGARLRRASGRHERGRDPRAAPRRRHARQRPRRPGGARPHRRQAARAPRAGADLRHLPRPPAALPRASGSRPTSCASATAAPTTRSRTSRPAGSRSRARTTASPCSARTASARSTATARCAGRPTSAPPQLTHLNLYDRTVEGLRLPQARASTVQYHPEAGPGPHDALHLFDRFIAETAALA